MSYQKRTANWVIQKAFLEAKLKSVAPNVGSTKYNVLLSMLDSEQKAWEEEPDVEWNSLFETVVIGTATTETEYDLDDSIAYITKRPGDFITIGATQFKLVNPNQLYEYREQNAVAQIAQTLKFSRPLASDSALIGQDISVPSYLQCDDITAGTNFVQCDSPMYLAYMLGASFIQDKRAKVALHDTLMNKAANLMRKMRQANEGQDERLVMNYSVYGETWD